MLPEPRVVSSKVSNCHLVRPALERFLKYTVGDVMDPACAASLAGTPGADGGDTGAAVAAAAPGDEATPPSEDEAAAAAAAAPPPPLDFILADFGAAGRLQQFWDTWWPRLACGGHLVVHSTLTNEASRAWLEERRATLRAGGGGYEVPHTAGVSSRTARATLPRRPVREGWQVHVCGGVSLAAFPLASRRSRLRRSNHR